MLYPLDVIWHQGEMLACVEDGATIIDVAGWGSGKSEGVVMKSTQLAALNWPIPVGVYEPTYPLVRDVLVPMYEHHYNKVGIPWRYNVNDHNMFFDLNGRTHQIMLRSTSNPENLKGPNLASVLIDEAGNHKHDAWRYLPPRARHPAAKVRQFVAVGTPEFNPDFQEWAEGPWDEKKKGKRVVIRACTYDNTYLQPSPEEYIRSKLSHLDETDLLQYVWGEFVAKGSRAYRSFNRSIHGVPCERIGNSRIEVGADFNVGKMSWICAISRGDEGHVFGELVRYDTTTWDQGEALTRYLQERIGKERGQMPTIEEVRRRTTISCDPSAKARKTTASDSDVSQLRRMGFEVRTEHNVIPVKDRAMTVNWRFRGEPPRLFVDVGACPKLTEALERQGRDPYGDPVKDKDPKKDMSAETDALGYWLWTGHPEWRATVPAGNTLHIGGYV